MLDSYGREITYLRLSVTDLCNLRCLYCMPEEGVQKKEHVSMLSEEEIVCAVEAAASLGISKVRITGGEPLVKRNILSICQRVSAVRGVREVAITTNGILLPQCAEALREAGVRRVNISLDTLNAEKYARITRCGRLDDALAGVHAALEAGFDKVKLNAVLIGGFNDDEIEDLVDLTRTYPLDMRFIELMPIGETGFGKEAYLPVTEVLKRVDQLEPQAVDGGTAKLYRLPDALGNVGLITPMSSHFCDSCNRLRLTADGKLKPCLHSRAEYSLKGLDRAGMTEVIKKAILDKPQWHGSLDYENRSRSQRSMNRIGG